METGRRQGSINDGNGLRPSRRRQGQCRTRPSTWWLVCRMIRPRGKRRQTAPRRRLWSCGIDSTDPVITDVGGGYGGGVTVWLRDNGIEPVSFIASGESFEKTKD